MNRRETITLLGGVAAWPLAARAQQPVRMRRIGVLMPGDESDPLPKALLSAFEQALADLGWTDGRVRIELRRYGDDNNRSRALAQVLVGLQPDIILTSGTPATVAVQRERRGRSQSSLRTWAIPSPAASSSGSTARVETSPDSPSTNPRWEASGLRCSRRSRLDSSGPQSCSIPTRPPRRFSVRSIKDGQPQEAAGPED